MYETLVLIDPENEITIAAAMDRISATLQASGSNATISQAGEGLSIEWPNFGVSVHRSALPQVVQESRQLADLLSADVPKREAISRCAARFEVSAGNDWEMVFFTDFCLVLESLEGLGTVYTFDQGSGEFTNL